MMKCHGKQFFVLIMSLVLVFTFSVSIGASTQNETYHGSITVDENSRKVALSGIEVQVFSAQPVGNSNTQVPSYYGETYAFSVYTDENGNFSFIKPSSFCSITVAVDSLPVGYGINQQVQFIAAGVNFHHFLLAQIADIKVERNFGQVIVDFYDENEKRLHVDYRIEETPITMEALSSQQLAQMTSYDLIGTVITPGEEISFSFPIDISEFSLQRKADYFYSEGMISEEKQIEVYCDIMLDSTLDHQSQCGTSIINKILEYQNRISEKKQNEIEPLVANENISAESGLTEKINQVSQQEPGSSFVSLEKIQRRMEDGLIVGFFYDFSNPGTPTFLIEELAEIFTEAYDYFVMELEFHAPIKHASSRYEVWCTYDVNESRKGITIYYQPNPGSSYMILNYAKYSTRELMECVVAHELHHAIMATYGFNENSCQTWVREGFSQMAGILYTEQVNNQTLKCAKTFLQNSHLSIDHESVDPYGTMLYPLYIYENLGGWSTLKQIYSNFSTTQNIYTAIANSGRISGYGEAFLGMFSSNYKPSAFYSMFKSKGYTELDSCVEIRQLDIGTTGLVDSAPMAGRYCQVANTTYVGTLYMTCSVISGSSSGFYLDKITENGSKIPEVETVAENFTQVTFVQQNFGSSVTKLVAAMVNADYTGTNVTCRISLST